MCHKQKKAQNKGNTVFRHLEALGIELWPYKKESKLGDHCSPRISLRGASRLQCREVAPSRTYKPPWDREEWGGGEKGQENWAQRGLESWNLRGRIQK